MTVCAAAGDDGSSDIRDQSQDDGKLHVDFPASSPFALACGGTRLEAANGKITREVVWNEGRQDGATGGGVSQVFDLPAWQKNANVPDEPERQSRAGACPDVSGDADPLTGYVVRIDGRDGVIGGTSAVAPLWAGLVALLNEKLGKPVGYLNPVLYGLPEGVFRDIDQGDNDVSRQGKPYKAGPGWDACTGLGSPERCRPAWRRCRQGRRRCERGRGGSGRGRPLSAFPSDAVLDPVAAWSLQPGADRRPPSTASATPKPTRAVPVTRLSSRVGPGRRRKRPSGRVARTRAANQSRPRAAWTAASSRTKPAGAVPAGTNCGRKVT